MSALTQESPSSAPTAGEGDRRPPRRRLRVLRVALISLAGLAAAGVVAVVGFLLVVPPPVDGFDPETWSPGPPATFSSEVTGEADAEVFSSVSVHGPEDVVVDDAGNVYTGDRDGIVWRFAADGGQPEVFARAGGRPLGMAFAPDGRLIVANHGAGLQAIHSDGRVETLLDEVAGAPILFANDLDISAAGVVYFSDSSSRYNTATLGADSSSYLLPDAIDGRANGRLVSFDLVTGESEVLLSDIYFPNGVALTGDESALWVAESNRYRVFEFDLATGNSRSVYENLPGTPDNIDRDASGRMLVAIYERNAALDTLVLPYSVSRQILIRLPSSLFVNEEDPLSGSILVARDDGAVTGYLTGLTPAATSIHPVGDRWYLGALLGQPIRWMEAP